MTTLNDLLTKEARQQGLTIHEPDDHILELWDEQGNILARFSQTGTTIDNVLRVISPTHKS